MHSKGFEMTGKGCNGATFFFFLQSLDIEDIPYKSFYPCSYLANKILLLFEFGPVSS